MIYRRRTNFAMDDSLIEAARLVGAPKAKRKAVTGARAENAKRSNQLRILKSFGGVTFDPSYDYKAERRRKPS
jgi:hypothetical protein